MPYASTHISLILCFRPVSSTLPIKVPVVEAGERGGLEQGLMTGRFLAAAASSQHQQPSCLADLRQQEVECLMKLFALACRYQNPLMILVTVASIHTLTTLTSEIWNSNYFHLAKCKDTKRPRT